jgi:hypothetical protein
MGSDQVIPRPGHTVKGGRNGMANHMKVCSCRGCKCGLRTPSGSSEARRVVRAARHKAKQALRRGDTPEPVFSLGYTD